MISEQFGRGWELKKLHVPRSGVSFYNVQCVAKIPSNCQDYLLPKRPTRVPCSGMPFFNVQCICVTKIHLFAKITYFFIAPHLIIIAPHLNLKKRVKKNGCGATSPPHASSSALATTYDDVSRLIYLYSINGCTNTGHYKQSVI